MIAYWWLSHGLIVRVYGAAGKVDEFRRLSCAPTATKLWPRRQNASNASTALPYSRAIWKIDRLMEYNASASGGARSDAAHDCVPSPRRTQALKRLHVD